MALYPVGHPSVRHSKVDWNNPLEWDENPEFKQALINEVVLHVGDALYLPTAYFHYIINLSLNYQCNARSGTTHENAEHIRECGFKMGWGYWEIDTILRNSHIYQTSFVFSGTNKKKIDFALTDMH